MQLHYVLKD